MSRWIVLSCLVVLPLLGQQSPPAPKPVDTKPPAADAAAPAEAKPAAAKPDSKKAPSKGKNSPSLPTEIGDLNAQPEYKVGVGDGLFISVWKEPEVTGEVQVRGDCRITMNLVKDLEVCGLTPTQIQDLVTEKLSKFIAAPDVTVTYRSNVSRKIFMIGQVRRPGGMVLNGPLTIADALSDAGGLSDYANEKSRDPSYRRHSNDL